MDRARGVVFTLAGVSLAAGLWAFPAEYRAVVVTQQPALEWYLAPGAPPLPPLRSADATYKVMVACDTALNSLTARLMPPTARAEVATRCLDAADRVLISAPGLAPAHLVRATALTQLAGQDRGGPDAQRIGEAGLALRFAERRGPELMWMVVRRMDVAIALFDGLPAEGRNLLARDLGRILAHGREEQVQHLARLYRRKESVQGFILATVEALPPGQQQRFVSALQANG